MSPTGDVWNNTGVLYNYPVNRVKYNYRSISYGKGKNVSYGHSCYLCYNASYADPTKSTIKEDCSSGDYVFMGALASSSSNTFALGAFGQSRYKCFLTFTSLLVTHYFTLFLFSVVFLNTSALNPQYSEGVYWYYEIGNSVGFTAVKDTTTRNGDTGTSKPEGRLSWIMTGKSGGFRAGNLTNSAELSTYLKQVYYCSNTPTASPTPRPTSSPTYRPTSQPTRQPSSQPTRQPSSQPSSQPTCQPSSQPTRQPTSRPTRQPTRQPSSQPTRQPSGRPTCTPTSRPSLIKFRDYFMIDSLHTDTYIVKDIETKAGDYFGGVAVSKYRVFVTGVTQTILLSKNMTSIMSTVTTRLDSLVSNLNTQEVFSLANVSGKISSPVETSVSIDRFRKLDSNDGTDGKDVLLTISVELYKNSFVFSGRDYVILVDSSTESAYLVNMTSDKNFTVNDVGKVVVTSRIQTSENWLSYGVVETSLSGGHYIVYASTDNTIERQLICSQPATTTCTGGYETIFSEYSIGLTGSLTVDLFAEKWYISTMSASAWESDNQNSRHTIIQSSANFGFKQEPTGRPTSHPSMLVNNRRNLTRTPTMKPTIANVFYPFSNYSTDIQSSGSGSILSLKSHEVGRYCGTSGALSYFRLRSFSRDKNMSYEYYCSVDIGFLSAGSIAPVNYTASKVTIHNGMANLNSLVVTCSQNYVLNRFILVDGSYTNSVRYKYYCVYFGSTVCTNYISDTVNSTKSGYTADPTLPLQNLTVSCLSKPSLQPLGNNTVLSAFHLQSTGSVYSYKYTCCWLSQPSGAPTGQPSRQPTRQPTAQPSGQPTRQPTTQPSRQPTRQPTGQPSRRPTAQPTRRPSQQPSSIPSSYPSSQPTSQPSRSPSSQPTRQPTRQPTGQPSRQPTCQPSRQPTRRPSGQPSRQPTGQPSRQPAGYPSSQPTIQPTSKPTNPTSQPTRKPTCQPSRQPTRQPTGQPSAQPSAQPVFSPSSFPTSQPTSHPTSTPKPAFPTSTPTAYPSKSFQDFMQFNVTQQLSGIKASDFKIQPLSQMAFKKAVAKSIATADGTSFSDENVDIVSMSATAPSRRRLLDATHVTRFLATASKVYIIYTLTVGLTKYAYTSSDAAYSQITASLTTAVSTKAFETTMSTIALSIGATNMTNITALSVEFGNFTYFVGRTARPTRAPTPGIFDEGTAGYYAGIAALTVVLLGISIFSAFFVRKKLYAYRKKVERYHRHDHDDEFANALKAQSGAEPIVGMMSELSSTDADSGTKSVTDPDEIDTDLNFFQILFSKSDTKSYVEIERAQLSQNKYVMTGSLATDKFAQMLHKGYDWTKDEISDVHEDKIVYRSEEHKVADDDVDEEFNVPADISRGFDWTNQIYDNHEKTLGDHQNMLRL